MKAVSRTHIGNVRSSNQDALITVPGQYGLFGVADGMGGHKAGDVASRMTVETLKEMTRGASPSANLLRSVIEEANRNIFKKQLGDADLDGMGTTVTVIWEDKERIFLGHVGDSRAYRIRSGQINQVSQDHSMVAEMVRDGYLTPEEAARHPYRNIITRALGVDKTVEVDIAELVKLPKDKYLLCSDGLYEYVTDDEMRKIITGMSMDAAADRLLKLALERGGRDNISLVIAEVDA